MAKNEKLKKLDVGETKSLSGGKIFAAPSSSYGKDVTMYYIWTPKGYEKAVSEASAKELAHWYGVSDDIEWFNDENELWREWVRLGLQKGVE